MATEEPKETVVIAEEAKDEAAVVAEEPKEIRDMKALQHAYAFAIPYGYAATHSKFAATPFAYGANSAKFAVTPYENAYTAAPYYGYTAPYYGYAAPVAFGAAPVAFAAPVKFTTQTYPFGYGTAQPYQLGSTQNYPSDTAKQQYINYAPQYAGYQNTGFPYSYGYGKFVCTLFS